MSFQSRQVVPVFSPFLESRGFLSKDDSVGRLFHDAMRYSACEMLLLDFTPLRVNTVGIKNLGDCGPWCVSFNHSDYPGRCKLTYCIVVTSPAVAKNES